MVNISTGAAAGERVGDEAAALSDTAATRPASEGYPSNRLYKATRYGRPGGW